MNIRYKNTSCDFADLWIGDAFIFYQDGERYTCMKITQIDADNYSKFINAVHLATGEALEIDPHEKVEKINATVIVE